MEWQAIRGRREGRMGPHLGPPEGDQDVEPDGQDVGMHAKMAFEFLIRQLNNQPPSTSTVVPVTKSFLMRNKIPDATSSAVPGRGMT